MLEFLRILECRPKKMFSLRCKKQFMLTNSGVMTSIFGSEASNCTPLALSMLLYLGHNPRLGGTILIWGGTSSDLGAQPRNAQPVAPGLLHSLSETLESRHLSSSKHFLISGIFRNLTSIWYYKE